MNVTLAEDDCMPLQQPCRLAADTELRGDGWFEFCLIIAFAWSKAKALVATEDSVGGVNIAIYFNRSHRCGPISDSENVAVS